MMTNTNGDGSGSLSERAMLCSLTISTFGNRRMDKQISSEAASSRGMGKHVGRYYKWLLIEDKDGKPVREWTDIISIRNKAGEVHRDITLPWMDDGTRINSARNFFEWAGEMRKLQSEFNEKVDYFCEQYDHLVQRTKLIMDTAAEEEGKPSMFNIKNYMSASSVRNHFAFSTHVMPLPEAMDFRVHLQDSQVSMIREQIQGNLNSVVMSATQHLFERLGELAHRVARLGDPKATIQAALSRDIESISHLAERLNIANDPYLNEFAKRIRKELAVEPVLLKTVPSERDALAARADAILADMSAFMGVGGEL